MKDLRSILMMISTLLTALGDEDGAMQDETDVADAVFCNWPQEQGADATELDLFLVQRVQPGLDRLKVTEPDPSSQRCWEQSKTLQHQLPDQPLISSVTGMAWRRISCVLTAAVQYCLRPRRKNHTWLWAHLHVPISQFCARIYVRRQWTLKL